MRAVTDVGAMNGERVEGPPTVIAKSRDDERAGDFFARESTKGNDRHVVNWKAGEETEPPRTCFDALDLGAAVELIFRQRSVFSEIKTPLTNEVGQAGLPRAGPLTGSDALALGEGGEATRHGERGREVLVEVRSIVGAPQLGQHQHVRIEFFYHLEDPRGPTPSVDSGVEIKRRYTHRSTLPGGLKRLWQSLMVESVDVTFGHRLWWVDAFIGETERGNPAVVVLLEHALSDVELQQIAFELGVSETAFVRRVGDQWSLRWFTPTVEVDLCGHATLATVHVLLNELEAPGGEFLRDPFWRALWAAFARRSGRNRPTRSYLEPIDPAVLNDTLGHVSEAYQAGPSSVLAVVDDYETLCALSVDPISLFLVPSSIVIAACYGGPDVDVSIRVFAPRLGLAEDPVTGSALCAVAPWWVEKVGSPTIAVRQASTRGGIMFARLFERNVEVAGRARTFFSGEIHP